MRITVSGAPNSQHKEVSKMLAERLECKYISARDITEDLFGSDRYMSYEFTHHKNKDLDDKANEAIFRAVRSSKDFVADSLLASVFAEDNISVFIDENFTSNQLFAESNHGDYVSELSVCSDFMDQPYDSFRNYDIYIDGTGLDIKAKIDIILDALRSGRSGIYTTASSVLPMTLTIPMSSNQHRSFESYYGKFCNGFLFVSNAILSQRDFLRSDTIIHVDNKLSEQGINYDVLRAVDYTSWFQMICPENTHLLVKIMLHHYCNDHEISDIREAFVKLSKNGDVLSTLINLGYLD